MKKKTFLTLTAAAVLTACSSDEPGGNTPRRDIEVSLSEQEVINAQQDFAFDLLNEGLENNQGNVAFSPFSVSIALSMTANGTEGAMQHEILDALNLDSTEDLAVMNGCAKRLIDEMPTLDNRTTLITAQSVWTRDNLALLDSFRRICADSYKASFGNYSTADDGASAINDWVSRNTKGSITNAVSPKEMDKIAIVNATYFNGLWSDQFKKDKTKRLSFRNADGTISIVDMMSDSKEFYRYWETENLQMVRLPYGNGSFSMYVVLPKEDKPVSDVFASISQESWQTMKKSMMSYTVNLKMPRFGFQTSNDIKETLQRLGINKLWDEATEAMTDPAVVMKKFIHNVRIIVDEEGTTAAAASTATGGDLIPSPGQIVEMNCNHPFAFIIEEQSTGAILFIGAINNL